MEGPRTLNKIDKPLGSAGQKEEGLTLYDFAYRVQKFPILLTPSKGGMVLERTCKISDKTCKELVRSLTSFI
jgi:hypothetical protein